MNYTTNYQSPFGKIILTAEESALTGLWFADQNPVIDLCVRRDSPILKTTCEWLDIYFSGREPDFLPEVYFSGSDFQNEVWAILRQIPYGKTMTYGEIAKIIAKRRGLAKMSAQAVGGAVGKNKISIIIPCHRVVGANKKLVGYAGGLSRKTRLLALEKSGLLPTPLRSEVSHHSV